MENPAPNFQQNVHSDKIKEGLFTAGLQNNAFTVVDGDKKSTHRYHFELIAQKCVGNPSDDYGYRTLSSAQILTVQCARTCSVYSSDEASLLASEITHRSMLCRQSQVKLFVKVSYCYGNNR